VFTALGVVSGLATWTLATSAGLAALLLASESIFVALKLAGAAYLVYLGLQALRGALRRGAAERVTVTASGRTRFSAVVAYRQGLISNLGNPKIAVFFTSLLPQFTPSGASRDGSFLVLLALGLLFSALTLAWLIAYVAAIARAGDVLRRPRIRRALDCITGTLLVAFGLRLATARR
jgi:threonine/homoserine/homoserine lactone efflux protein